MANDDNEAAQAALTSQVVEDKNDEDLEESHSVAHVKGSPEFK
jgi:hypothetical protein